MNEKIGINKKIIVGATISLSRKVAQEDIESFGKLSLDKNPIHFDDDFAAKSMFGKRIAHGMIGAFLISGALTKLMGEGNVWLSLSLKFAKPVYIGDKISCTLTVKEIDRRGIATIDAEIVNEEQEKVTYGSLQSMRF